MKKQHRLQAIKSILENIVPKINGAPPLAHFHIQEVWKETVGVHIAKKTYADGIRNGIVYVNVETSAWMQELTFMKPEILKRLNEVLPAPGVKDIRFKLGKMQPVENNSDADMVPLTEAERILIEKQTAGIKDTDIRASLQSLFTAQIKLSAKKKRTRL